MVRRVRLPRPANDGRLARRVEDNERALRQAYVDTMAVARDARSITPAADWLVDNFRVVQEQVRAIRIDLLPDFQWQLPKLTDGPLRGYSARPL
jgi:cyclic beta-1,2-glucan synthetase